MIHCDVLEFLTSFLLSQVKRLLRFVNKTTTLLSKTPTTLYKSIGTKMANSTRRIPSFQAFLFVFSLVLWRASSFVGRQYRFHEPSSQSCPVFLSESTDILEGAPEGFQETASSGEAVMIEELPEGKDSRTLYEILGAPATATRAELKKCYVAMAKLSHPDARMSSDPMTFGQNIDFNEIAQAWRILGDPKLRKRYDRELRAQAFAESAQRFTNENLERAVPAVANMMDKVAAPFLRRTTATTWAMGNAVAQGVSNENGGLSDAFKKAVQAGQEAGRFIDSVELTEKSQRLEER